MITINNSRQTYQRIVFLIIGNLVGIVALLPAQNAQIFNTRDSLISRAWLGKIAIGENIPTTIQSLSAQELSYYGVHTEPKKKIKDQIDETEIFFAPLLLISPQVMGWNGLGTARWEGDKSARTTESSYLSRFHEFDPVFALGIEFGSPHFFATSSIDFGMAAWSKNAPENGITGFWDPLKFLTWWNFPDEAYFSWVGSNTNLIAGRLPTGIGLGMSNIMLNGNARWYDQVQFSWWSNQFKFFGFWATSATHLDDIENEVQQWQGMGEKIGWDAVSNHDYATRNVTPAKLFTYHRVEFKPFQRIGFGLTEMQLLGGKTPDLLNLLPAGGWHNTFTAGVSNVMMQIDAWGVPINGLLLRGEFVTDDTKAPAEKGTAAKPNSWAWELGATWVLPFTGTKWTHAIDAEYSHVDTWTYNRWQPWLIMYQRQMFTGGHGGIDIPLGHSEGGDVDQGKLYYTAISSNGGRIKAGYTYTNKGPVYLGRIEKANPMPPSNSTDPSYIPVYYDFDDYQSLTGKTLESLLGTTRKHKHEFSVSGSWPLNAQWEVYASINLHLIYNAEHVRGKMATETVWKTGFTWKL
ncbi:MAG TPA: hypothetical protein VJ861_05605 [Treponemataceae bacterium]|nr:hypothetical protein [Treponemataceae bacterium]